ncbi:MAG TPA: ABC transporter ATP-binding protein [Firmicutes bacterium]|mgnify:CR=1 FL=1|nr:ABC transporter ATP-binding protein [Bacillota bacterium]
MKPARIQARKKEIRQYEEGVILSNVQTGYDRKIVLQEINLTVRMGGFLCLLGPNGSGKSTLLKTIIKYLPVSAGRITLLGNDLSSLTPKDIARRVGVVPQKLDTRFELTVRELVMLGRYPHLRPLSFGDAEDGRIVEESMAAVDILHLGDRLITEISGGELQRAIVAQALTQTPQILILDEPTTHLDISHQIALCELLLKLNQEKGLTIIAALHDLNLAARYCQEVVLLKDGKVFAAGLTDEVLSEALLEEVYGVRVRKERDPFTGKPYFTYYTKNNLCSPPAEYEYS